MLDGHGKAGDTLYSNDDIASGGVNLNSRLSVSLQPGIYTIEATTYKPAIAGRFTLAMEGLVEAAETTPDPQPEPGPEADTCIESIDGDGTVEGSWDDSCLTLHFCFLSQSWYIDCTERRGSFVSRERVSMSDLNGLRGYIVPKIRARKYRKSLHRGCLTARQMATNCCWCQFKAQDATVAQSVMSTIRSMERRLMRLLRAARSGLSRTPPRRRGSPQSF